MCFYTDYNLTLHLNFSFTSELKSMETQQTSVERLSSGVVKRCWIWHGKLISLKSIVYRNRIIAYFRLVLGYAGLFISFKKLVKMQT